MTRHLLILLIILLSFTLRCFPQIIEDDSKLREIVKQDGQVEVTIPLTDKRTLDDLTRNVSILSVRDKLVYISLSPLTVEWFILQKFNYLVVDRIKNKGVVTALNINEAWDWETYPTYSQYDSIMQSFVTIYPDLCHLDTIGTSINGQLVLALKISDNAGTEEDEPEVFYSSTMHGDELAGYVLMLRLMDYLLKNYNLNNRVKYLVDNLEIWINPLANPDGTYNTGNTITLPTRYNANSYDLNRNFPDPITPNTVKQKETLDMIKFMGKHRFVLSANFHSGAEVVNYPWDRWFSKFHADDSWFYNISREYADTVQFYSGTGYMTDENEGVTRGAEWYIAYGTRQDFVTWELHGREVTIEIDVIKETPAAQLDLLWLYNWRSFLGYLENALYGIHGMVLDSRTDVPVPAKVFITGHDKDSSHVYSDTLTGSFIRLLEPGLWDLTFSANGYHDTTFTDLTVFSGQKTEIVVNLTPLANRIDTTIPAIPTLYPNPAKTVIYAVLPDKMTGNLNVKVVNQSGMLISDYITEAVEGIPVSIDVKKLSGGIYTVIFINTDTKIICRSRFIVVK